MRCIDVRHILLALAMLLCVGCAAQPWPAQAPPASPSPTIAAAGPAARLTPPPARPSPTIPSVRGHPTSAPMPNGQAAEPSIYLWPAYLPQDMRPSPSESRVAAANETGAVGLGFYVVTLSGGSQKLSIGGGDLSAALPLSGEERRVTAGTRSGKLITSGDRREIVFDVPRGKLFVYSSGLSEDELLKVAASLQPIDVQALQELVGVK